MDIQNYLEKIIEEILKWKNKPLDVVCNELNIEISDKNKSKRFLILKKIVDNNYYEFKQVSTKYFKILFKTLLVDTSNFLREHIVLSKISLSDFEKGKIFENSNFFKIVNSIIIFVIFNNENNIETISNAIIFEFNNEQKEKAKYVFENTKDLFLNGGIQNKDNKSLNFIKFSDKQVFHIRPKAKDSYDTYKTQAGETITKQAFWLNKDVIESYINSIFLKNRNIVNNSFISNPIDNFNNNDNRLSLQNLLKGNNFINVNFLDLNELKKLNKSIFEYISNLFASNILLIYKVFGNYYDDFKIGEIGFSTRTTNALIRSKIFLLNQLVNISISKLCNTKNLGKNSLTEIFLWLKENVIVIEKKENSFNYIHYSYNYKQNNEISDSKLNSKDDSKLNSKEIKDDNFIIEFVFDRYLLTTSESIIQYISNRNNRANISLLFVINDVSFNDFEIIKIGFSVRTVNALTRSGIFLLSQLVNMPLNKLCSIQNLGKTSLNEVFFWIKKNAIIVVNKINQYLSKIINFLENFNNDYINLTKYTISEIIWNCTKNNIVENLSFSELEPFLKDNPKWKEYQSNFILWVLKNNNQRMKFNDLSTYFSKNFIPIKQLNFLLDDLVHKGKILNEENFYLYKWQNFEDYVNKSNISDLKKKVIIERILEGKPLEKVGQDYGITRERVRQIVERFKAAKDNIKVFEDLYANIFQEYKINLEIANEILEINKKTFNYLNNFYNSGNKKILHLLSDENCDNWIKEKTRKYILRNYIEIDGEFVERKRNEILNFLLRTYCVHETHFDDFFEMYKDFLNKNQMNINDLNYFYDLRILSNKLASSDFILWKTGRKFRYYEIDKINPEIFFNNLELLNFYGKEISTKLVFDINKDLMNQYDILDEYELHNLMKKLHEKVSKNAIDITFKRMPIISIGNSDRNEQVLNLLLEENPIRKENFAEKYELRYGVKKESVLANFLDCISNYLDSNGIYVVRDEILSSEEILRISKTFTEKIYTVNQAKNLFFETLPYKSNEYFNSYNLKEIGFSFYRNIVIKNEFSSMEKFLENYFIEKEIADFSGELSIALLNSTFIQIIPLLLKKYKIFEFYKNKYLSLKKIEDFGFSIENLRDFVNQVLKFTDGDYFTFYWLEKNNFYHEIFEMGFDNYFYENLLKYDSRVKSVMIGKTLLFKEQDGENYISKESFISSIVASLLKIDIYDLISLIYEKYNIIIEKGKLISIAKDSKLYYSEIKEKLYIDYDEYFEEI